MFELKQLKNLNNYFDPLSAREEKGVYFYRINCYNAQIDAFIRRYYELAKSNGVVIEGRLQNPNEKNLAYYEEIMGTDFQNSPSFFVFSLKKWLPRMGSIEQKYVAAAIYDILDAMRQEGKNESMLKNAYIKFMCWLYYKFDFIINRLGTDKVAKILYEGTISKYELSLLSILSKAGCDVVLLQYNGDGEYKKLDSKNVFSFEYTCSEFQAYPQGFSIEQMRKQQHQQTNIERAFGAPPKLTPCTNAWITGDCFLDILKIPKKRGEDENLFYNCFIRILGVQDKLTYPNELYQLQLKLKADLRKIVIIDKQIAPPSMEEIAKINRKNYNDLQIMLADLAKNIQFSQSVELQRLMVKAFVQVMTQMDKTQSASINKRISQAVYLLSWLKRYEGELFSNWKNPEIACFIYLGGCKNENEAAFLKLLAKLPVDVLILVPNLNCTCCLKDEVLFEKSYSDSLAFDKFPTENSEIKMGTVAFHAERELDTIMYQDSGMYRNQQYKQAVSLSLQTTYEEIAILWDQELKYRPNFSVVNGAVTLPVIFAKVSGVKDAHLADYWAAIKALEVEDTWLLKNPQSFNAKEQEVKKSYATEFLNNGKLKREQIKKHKSYLYSFLREEIQEHILDKLQLLLQLQMIKGTNENGMEYTVISTVLNLPKEVLRLLQKFDFTKKNPKLVYINTKDTAIEQTDAIITAFLHLAGFDVLFFIPTGYQSADIYFTKKAMQEHQIGEYMYDLQIPNFQSLPGNIMQSWREILFGKKQ